MVLACLAVIKERCKGHISLAHVTLQLVELLPDDNVSNKANRSYLNQLTKINHKRKFMASRGHNTSEAIAMQGVQPAQEQTAPHTLRSMLPDGLTSVPT